MHALLLGSESPDASRDLARPVAGAPLLVRQIEWLQKSGITHLLVHRVALDPLPPALRTEQLAVSGVRVTWIPAGTLLDEVELFRRAQFPDAPTIVLAHGTLGSLDLQPLVAQSQAQGNTIEVRADNAFVRVLPGPDPGRPVTSMTVPEGAWLRRVVDESSAQDLTESLLSGLTGVVIRGTQVTPGIWRGRGAVVVEGAQLIPPCLLGPGCFVAEGATLGPGGILDERAVLEAKAVVTHGRVAEGVIVGQGLLVQNALVEPGRIIRHRGRTIPIDDPFLIGGVSAPKRWPRVAAAVALGAVAPFAALSDGAGSREMVRRLARVVEGTSQWMGVRTPAEPDRVVVDVLPLLVPPDAQKEEREAAFALYQAKKSLRLDTKLLLATVLRVGQPRSPRA